MQDTSDCHTSEKLAKAIWLLPLTHTGHWDERVASFHQVVLERGGKEEEWQVVHTDVWMCMKVCVCYWSTHVGIGHGILVLGITGTTTDPHYHLLASIDNENWEGEGRRGGEGERKERRDGGETMPRVGGKGGRVTITSQ